MERPREKRWRAIVVLLAALLAASLVANFYIARTALGYLRTTTAVRLDPSGMKAHASDPMVPADLRPLLVFFGDSRIAMWPPPKSLDRYRIVNRGVGYQTTAQMLLRLDADAIGLHPAVVVVEAGVNDLRAIADFPQQRAEIVGDCERNLARIVGRCREAGATVVLVTVFDTGDVALWRRPFWSDDVVAAVHEVNAFLPTLTGDNVVLWDANAVLVDADGKIRHDYQIDHLHLSTAGYDALNARLGPFLSALARR
jgi:lysophospholipase L1-like esterase